MIFSSHDHQLTQTVANRIIEINPDGSITTESALRRYVHLADIEANTRSSVINSYNALPGK